MTRSSDASPSLCAISERILLFLSLSLAFYRFSVFICVIYLSVACVCFTIIYSFINIKKKTYYGMLGFLWSLIVFPSLLFCPSVSVAVDFSHPERKRFMLCILSFLLICCRRCVGFLNHRLFTVVHDILLRVLWRRDEIEAFAYTMIVINVCLWFKFEQSCVHWGVKFGPKQRENTVLVVWWCFSRRLVWLEMDSSLIRDVMGMGRGGCHFWNQLKNPEKLHIFYVWLKTNFAESWKFFKGCVD